MSYWLTVALLIIVGVIVTSILFFICCAVGAYVADHDLMDILQEDDEIIDLEG